MNEKNKNQIQAKNEFEYRVKETKKTAINENKKKAKETGNKLTQNIQKDGTLYTVNNTSLPKMPFNTNNLESNEVVSGADIRNELFDKDNIHR